MHVEVYDRKTRPLPTPDPAFQPEFIRRELAATLRTQQEDARLDRLLIERFGRVWKIHNTRGVRRAFHRFMFVIGH